MNPAKEHGQKTRATLFQALPLGGRRRRHPGCRFSRLSRGRQALGGGCRVLCVSSGLLTRGRRFGLLAVSGFTSFQIGVLYHLASFRIFGSSLWHWTLCEAVDREVTLAGVSARFCCRGGGCGITLPLVGWLFLQRVDGCCVVSTLWSRPARPLPFDVSLKAN